MPDLATELDHLARADEHIAQIQRRIAEARERAASGQLTELSEQLLKTMKGSLQACVDHRALIVRTIDDLKRAAAAKGEPP